MPEPTVDDVLVRWRERMLNRATVVVDPLNLYEDASGNRVDLLDRPLRPGEATRGCMLGNATLAAFDLGMDPHKGAAQEAFDLVDAVVPSLGEAIQDIGIGGCVQAIDSVIALRRAEDGR